MTTSSGTLVQAGGFRKMRPGVRKVFVGVDTDVTNLEDLKRRVAPKYARAGIALSNFTGFDTDIFVQFHFRDAQGNITQQTLCWNHHQFDRPDLGVNSKQNPFQALGPVGQEYAITMGDDPDGTESEVRKAAGQEPAVDEGLKLLVLQLPANLIRIVPIITVYDWDEVGLTLGDAGNITVSVTDLDGSERYLARPAEQIPDAFCFVPGALVPEGGTLVFHGPSPDALTGTSDDPWRVARALAVGANCANALAISVPEIKGREDNDQDMQRMTPEQRLEMVRGKQ